MKQQVEATYAGLDVSKTSLDIDGHAPAFFFRLVVSIHTGQGLDQCRLAVVDVARRSHGYHSDDNTSSSAAASRWLNEIRGSDGI
ncbi:MAG: hypothetical protein V3W14_08780 [Candidatus Neomarinimicrobiota bacterium]